MQLIKCPECEYEGNAKAQQSGSLLLTILLLLLGLLPGLIYIYCINISRRYSCPRCLWSDVILIKNKFI